MAAISAARTRIESAGSLTRLIFTFTTVSDGDTFASGLGTRVASYNYQMTGNPATQASAGASLTNSSGTFTFYPGEDALGAVLTADVIG
jgi:hypothetical protein